MIKQIGNFEFVREGDGKLEMKLFIRVLWRTYEIYIEIL